MFAPLAVHEIRQSKQKRNCPLQQARLTYTARRRTFHVKPALPPCAASQLDFAGWALGEGRNDVSKSPQHIRAQHSVSMNFQLRVFCRRPARRADSYGFVLPPADDA